MERAFRTMIMVVLAMGTFAAGRCSAQEPAADPTHDELRREVAELRSAVAELTRRLETLEYQKMPRAEIRTPELVEPRVATPSYVWPTVQPAGFPIDLRNRPTALPSFRQKTVPAYLQFPEEVERAMLGPF